MDLRYLEKVLLCFIHVHALYKFQSPCVVHLFSTFVGLHCVVKCQYIFVHANIIKSLYYRAYKKYMEISRNLMLKLV